MADETKQSMLALIERNIETSGYHVYLVIGGADPRFAYTIGLRESPIAAELILAGSIIFSAEEVLRILDVIRRRLMMTLKFDSPTPSAALRSRRRRGGKRTNGRCSPAPVLT